MNRRGFLGAAGVGTVAALGGCTGSFDTGPETTETNTTDSTTTDSATETGTSGESQPDSVGLETLASGFDAPVSVAFAPDADRRYVADQPGRILRHESDGLADAPFLDLRDAVEVGSEKGLLGIALHPNFAENRRLFVRYSAPPRSGTPEGYSHTFVLAEFTATDDGRRAKPDSERAILEIPEPQGNHNAGSVAFGPNGFLYVGVGDGGAGGDQGAGHVADWYNAVAGGNGQDVTKNLLGSILRIDVDGEEGGRPYAIPDDNPLVGRDGRDEHYAWGFRNPWRFSFDRQGFFVGDVGQNNYEEVSLVEKGGNYGWNVKEGTHCYSANDCPDSTPDGVRGGERLVDPIIEYPHSGAPVSGVSVIDGGVYRGSAVPELGGTYVFADLQAKGRLFAATRPDDGGLWPTRVLPVSDADSGKIEQIFSIRRDAAGELYVLGTGAGGGGLHRVTPSE